MRFFEKQVIISLFALCVITVAHADSAFDYNRLEAGIGITRFAAPLYLGSIKYKATNDFRLSGSYQFDDNAFASLTKAVQRSSGYSTEIKSDRSALGLGYVIPLKPSIDVGLMFSYLSGSAEICDVSCTKTKDHGVSTGIFLNSWLTQNIEIDVTHENRHWKDSGNLSSNDIGIGAYVGMKKKHKLELSLGRTSEGDENILISYTYTFNNHSLVKGRPVKNPGAGIVKEPKKIKKVPVNDELARPPVLIIRKDPAVTN